MKTHYIKAAGLIALVSFGTSGCAPTADGRKAQAQGTGIGAILGAGLGAGVAALTGGNIGQGAAIGAGAGAAAGFVYGSAVAKRKAHYVSAEAWLNEEIRIAHNANARAVAYNQSLKRRLASLESRASAARSAGNQGELRKLKSEVGAIRTEAANQAKSEAQFDKDRSEVLGDSKARSSSNYGQYRQASQAWSNAKSERSTLINRTASLNSSIGG